MSEISNDKTDGKDREFGFQLYCSLGFCHPKSSKGLYRILSKTWFKKEFEAEETADISSNLLDFRNLKLGLINILFFSGAQLSAVFSSFSRDFCNDSAKIKKRNQFLSLIAFSFHAITVFVRTLKKLQECFIIFQWRVIFNGQGRRFDNHYQLQDRSFA